MAKKAVLLTVHGMGETKRDYAQPLLAAIAKRLGAKSAGLETRTVYYQDLLQPNEQDVWDRVGDRVRWSELRKFVLFGFADAAGIENGKESLGSVYALAQVAIARELFLAREAVGGDGPVVVIAQSLGCHVFSCYLWDAQQFAASAADPTKRPRVGLWQDPAHFEAAITGGPPLSPDEMRFVQGATVRAFVTTGCNIPVFVAAHATADVVPIAKPNPAFEWRNFYDPDDVLGWPLGALSPGYAALVEDHAINAGHGLLGWIAKSWNPMAHTQYWEDGDVLDPLEQILRPLL